MIKKLLRSLAGDHIFMLKDIQKKLFPRRADRLESSHLKERELFYAGFISTDELVFDIGANTGNRVVPLLNIGAKVVAAEPQESCYKYLQKKFGNKIILVTKGLSDKAETRDFFVSDATVFSSFSTEWIDSVKQKRLKDYQWNKQVKVEMTTLDHLIGQYGVPVFIKIDVEGFELQVLKGLSHKIKMISFEYTTPEQTLKAQQCIEHLQTIDARIECNYCIGEVMHFKLQQWVGANEMMHLIALDEFVNSRFGDIYVRMGTQV